MDGEGHERKQVEWWRDNCNRKKKWKAHLNLDGAIVATKVKLTRIEQQQTRFVMKRCALIAVISISSKWSMILRQQSIRQFANCYRQLYPLFVAFLPFICFERSNKQHDLIQFNRFGLQLFRRLFRAHKKPKVRACMTFALHHLPHQDWYSCILPHFPALSSWECTVTRFVAIIKLFCCFLMCHFSFCMCSRTKKKKKLRCCCCIRN